MWSCDSTTGIGWYTYASRRRPRRTSRRRPRQPSWKVPRARQMWKGRAPCLLDDGSPFSATTLTRTTMTTVTSPTPASPRTAIGRCTRTSRTSAPPAGTSLSSLLAGKDIRAISQASLGTASATGIPWARLQHLCPLLPASRPSAQTATARLAHPKAAPPVLCVVNNNGSSTCGPGWSCMQVNLSYGHTHCTHGNATYDSQTGIHRNRHPLKL